MLQKWSENVQWGSWLFSFIFAVAVSHLCDPLWPWIQGDYSFTRLWMSKTVRHLSSVSKHCFLMAHSFQTDHLLLKGSLDKCHKEFNSRTLKMLARFSPSKEMKQWLCRLHALCLKGPSTPTTSPRQFITWELKLHNHFYCWSISFSLRYQRIMQTKEALWPMLTHVQFPISMHNSRRWQNINRCILQFSL